VDFSEPLADIRGASPEQVTVEKLLPLEKLNLEPGQYLLSLKMEDEIKNEVLTPMAKFVVK
jgi:hypothetical protein